jgi:hypothetical protein
MVGNANHPRNAAASGASNVSSFLQSAACGLRGDADKT